MTTTVASTGVGADGVTKATKLEDGQRKLPRPIVFWSINEKTAYRRNRVVQTRMNMIMDDLANQQESSRKNIRYEAHKFRQKSGKYYNHPAAAGDANSSVNIAPPNWKNPKAEREKTRETPRARSSDFSDSDSCSDDDENTKSGDVNKFSPRKAGIITRAKKPVVKFSMFKEVRKIEDDLKIDDIDDVSNKNANDNHATEFQQENVQIRSLSALQYREIPDLPGQPVQRLQSALPALQTHGETAGNRDKFSNRNPFTNKETYVKPTCHLRSDTFFDKSKAAYQLRQDLKKRAKMRKQGFKASIFTLKDALDLERENFMKNTNRVIAYIKRIEAAKHAERMLINKWTMNAFESQLQI